MFKTRDNSIFETYELAEDHSLKINMVSEIINLLGGKNQDIDNTSSFSNGGGYYIINKEDYEKALEKIELLCEKLEFKYKIYSREASEHKYLRDIFHIQSCIVVGAKDIIRVGQPYYAVNPLKLGDKIYNKKG
jgi:hypothetical protein